MALPQAPHQRWSLDFVSDALSNGRRLRILVVVDDFIRECLSLVADTSLLGARVARDLECIMTARGRPLLMVSDNGTELKSLAVLEWCQRHDVDRHSIAPGKPQQSGSVESFIGCLRDECLNETRSVAWPMRDQSSAPGATTIASCDRMALATVK